MRKKEKILYVDDDEKIIKTLKNQLDEKYNVDYFANPINALKSITQDNFYAVVIADMKMPGLDGINFLEKVKRKSPQTTRIMITGNAELDIAIDAINKGQIFKFLTKPCLKQDLINTIEQAIKNYRNRMKLQTESLTDPLTGLWNRRYFNLQLIRILKTAERYKFQFSLIFIDINYFKKINDEFGHNKGDLILKTIAKLLKETCRKTDIIARYGGDEFIIIIEHNDKNGALCLVNRLKKVVSEKYIDKKRTINISIAIGIATYPNDAKENSTLIKIADKAMYQNKKEEKKTSFYK
jgi:two-component system, cell cycle response regulator